LKTWKCFREALSEGKPSQQSLSAGLINEVEVERENGRLLVEVKIIDADDKKTELKVDPENKRVIR
jgi:uncharacterized membrane protein YkoI